MIVAQDKGAAPAALTLTDEQKKQLLENLLRLSETNAVVAIFLAKQHLGMKD